MKPTTLHLLFTLLLPSTGLFRGEELSESTPDLPRRVLFPAHHEISSNLPVQ